MGSANEKCHYNLMSPLIGSAIPRMIPETTFVFLLFLFHKKTLQAKGIKNNAWVTVNNDFLSRVRRFGNDFHEWRSHEWKSLPNRLTSDKKIVIHGNECIILFLTCYFMWWTHKSAKNYHRALISPLLPRAAFFWPSIVTSSQLICDVTRTQNTGIVTSYSSIVIARTNWRKGDLHWWITAVNIDISPPGIHGLACKKTLFRATSRQ